MANIASAEKQRRQAEKSKARNRAGKSSLKTALKKARTVIEGGDEQQVIGRLAQRVQLSQRVGVAGRVQLMSTNSDKAREYCRLCATFCRECAEECAKHNNDHCKPCAAACEKCAAECEAM